jgi:hypothetical protein
MPNGIKNKETETETEISGIFEITVFEISGVF